MPMAENDDWTFLELLSQLLRGGLLEFLLETNEQRFGAGPLLEFLEFLLEINDWTFLEFLEFVKEGPQSRNSRKE